MVSGSIEYENEVLKIQKDTLMETMFSLNQKDLKCETGFIEKIFDTKISGTFKKKDFVLSVLKNNKREYFLFTCFFEKCEELSGINLLSTVDVFFKISGSKFKNRNTGEDVYSNCLKVEKIDVITHKVNK